MTNKIIAFLAAILIVGFGFYLSQVKWLAILFLIGAFGLIFYSLRKIPYDKTMELFGLQKGKRNAIIYFFIAAISSIALALYYKSVQEQELIFSEIRPFFIIAILIGITEELVCRGYFYGNFIRSPLLAVLFAAFVHAAYKTAIFVPFPEVSLLTIGGLTFLAGLFIGYLRYAGGSILPCVLFHALFDFLVYGDKHTPWWVW